MPKNIIKEKYLNCEICGKLAMKNKVICSDKCAEIRLKIYYLVDEYFPTPGCDNCLGDLGEGCTEKCKKEFKEASKFSKDLYELVNLILTNKDK